MSGPLPDENAIRRNAPIIPTTALPLSGRQGDIPDVPSWITLSDAGQAWWDWAWRTPQSSAWGTSVGMEASVAQRASLEDDLAALDSVEGLNWDSLEDAKIGREFREVVSRVAALATGRLQLLKHANDLDNQLGLTPKGMANLRWKIVNDALGETSNASKKSGNVTYLDDQRSRLLADGA